MSDQPYGEDPLRKRPDETPGEPPFGQQPPPGYGQQQPPYGQQPPPYGYGEPGYGAAGYGAAGYGGQPTGPSQESADAKRQGIIATVVGAVTTLCCCLPGGLVGLGLGIAGLSKSGQDVAGARKFSRNSLIVSAVSAVLGLLFWIVIFATGNVDQLTDTSGF